MAVPVGADLARAPPRECHDECSRRSCRVPAGAKSAVVVGDARGAGRGGQRSVALGAAASPPAAAGARSGAGRWARWHGVSCGRPWAPHARWACARASRAASCGACRRHARSELGGLPPHQQWARQQRPRAFRCAPGRRDTGHRDRQRSDVEPTPSARPPGARRVARHDDRHRDGVRVRSLRRTVPTVGGARQTDDRVLGVGARAGPAAARDAARARGRGVDADQLRPGCLRRVGRRRQRALAPFRMEEPPASTALTCASGDRRGARTSCSSSASTTSASSSARTRIGAISAFRAAFGRERDTAVRLIVKSINGEPRPDDVATIAEACGGDPRIELVDEHLDDARHHALLAAADCLVSLHRSEGYGLHPALAMWSGRWSSRRATPE